MHPFLYLWLAAIVFSLVTGRWIVVASLCWIAAALFDFLLIALVVKVNMPVDRLPNPDSFMVLGILVITVTLALIWLGSRRAARVVWWLCTFFGGAWLCLLAWRWIQAEVEQSRDLIAAALAFATHAMTAFAISRMWPRRVKPAYTRAFE